MVYDLRSMTSNIPQSSTSSCTEYLYDACNTSNRCASSACRHCCMNNLINDHTYSVLKRICRKIIKDYNRQQCREKYTIFDGGNSINVRIHRSSSAACGKSQEDTKTSGQTESGSTAAASKNRPSFSNSTFEGKDKGRVRDEEFPGKVGTQLPNRQVEKENLKKGGRRPKEDDELDDLKLSKRDIKQSKSKKKRGEFGDEDDKRPSKVSDAKQSKGGKKHADNGEDKDPSTKQQDGKQAKNKKKPTDVDDDGVIDKNRDSKSKNKKKQADDDDNLLAKKRDGKQPKGGKKDDKNYEEDEQLGKKGNEKQSKNQKKKGDKDDEDAEVVTKKREGKQSKSKIKGDHDDEDLGKNRDSKPSTKKEKDDKEASEKKREGKQSKSKIKGDHDDEDLGKNRDSKPSTKKEKDDKEASEKKGDTKQSKSKIKGEHDDEDQGKKRDSNEKQSKSTKKTADNDKDDGVGGKKNDTKQSKIQKNQNGKDEDDAVLAGKKPLKGQKKNETVNPAMKTKDTSIDEGKKGEKMDKKKKPSKRDDNKDDDEMQATKSKSKQKSSKMANQSLPIISDLRAKVRKGEEVVPTTKKGKGAAYENESGYRKNNAGVKSQGQTKDGRHKLKRGQSSKYRADARRLLRQSRCDEARPCDYLRANMEQRELCETSQPVCREAPYATTSCSYGDYSPCHASLPCVC